MVRAVRHSIDNAGLSLGSLQMVKPAWLLADIIIFLALVAASVSFIPISPLTASGTESLLVFSGALGIHDAELTWTAIFFLIHCLIALGVLFVGKGVFARIVNVRH